MPRKILIWSLLPFQSFMKGFFLPIHSSPSAQGCMIIWAEWFTARRENNTGMKTQPETDACAGKTLLSAPPCRNGVFFLSEQNPKKEVGSFLCIYFPWKSLFLPRYLFMPNTINNFQNFRKLLKSSGSAKKLSLGIFYCLLRSSWTCSDNLV